jgi:hypothetical protein
MNRTFIAVAIPAVAFVAILALTCADDSGDVTAWPETARTSCESHRFAMPQHILPPELRVLLGDRSNATDARLKDSFKVAIVELVAHSFPGTPVNINCELGAYRSDAVNIYMVASDPDQTFRSMHGMILTRSDAERVLVMGDEFWNFFFTAWRPILEWQSQMSSPDRNEALADQYIEGYEFYLEWAVAHELGHMRLGHRPAPWYKHSQQRTMELAADVEAAKSLKAEYFQITGHLLGLIKETMKYQFELTYHRPWQASDGEAFESFGPDSFRETPWHVTLFVCDSTHPPFLMRSIGMLEAVATIAKEQTRSLRDDSLQRQKQILAEDESVEGQIALEQLEEEDVPMKEPTDRWADALSTLAVDLRMRVDVNRRWMFCSK